MEWGRNDYKPSNASMIRWVTKCHEIARNPGRNIPATERQLRELNARFLGGLQLTGEAAERRRRIDIP